MQSKDGEIEYIGLDIHLLNLEKGIPFVLDFLEERGAAVGSRLQIEVSPHTKEIVFGRMEGVGIYLDGVTLPPEVYQTSDINVVIAELEKAMGQKGEVRGHWHGPKETALYLYGDSAAEIEASIKPFMDKYPLCKNARVVRITPLKGK